MNSNKYTYFSHRNRTLAGLRDRAQLGEREIRTFLTMLDVADPTQFLAGKAVVDLGCGDQYIRAACESRGATYRGLDIDECNVESDTFPLRDGQFDVAVCLALIEHLRDPGHFLEETKRVLKPGGVIWLSTPDIEACGSKFWNDPTHVHPYTRSSLRMLLQMNGFADVLVTPNYRCKPRKLYRDRAWNFFRARHLMPFAGTSRIRVPEWLKGGCTGLFALGINSR